MEQLDSQTPFLPPALMAEVEAAAAAEQRPVREMLREAVELYLQDRRPTADPAFAASRTPEEAATRMLERRRLHPLPAGVSIRDLLTFGRA